MVTAQSVTDFRDLLREHGLRVTSPRIAVLSAIDGGAHLDAETVAERARKRLGSISTQTVYDVLAAFTGAGILRRIEPAGSPARYERRVGDNHHHVVCRECGAIEDVECAVGSAPCLDPSAPHETVGDQSGTLVTGRSTTANRVLPATTGGTKDAAANSAPNTDGYLIDEVEVMFWGLCPLCRTRVCT